MKKVTCLLTAIVAGVVMMLVVGCSFLTDNKDEIHAAIINYAETKGVAAANAYVDQLVADGKLEQANAEKIKTAIPQGIEKLKNELQK